MNPWEKQIINKEKTLEERAREFAIGKAGRLVTGMNPELYWDDYYDAYYDYLESEGTLGMFSEAELERGEEYTFFTNSDSRAEIYQFSKSIAEYLKGKNVKNLVIADKSARPLYLGVMEYWREEYPNIPMPNIYFVNPKGFKSTDEFSRKELERINDNSVWRGDLNDRPDKARSTLEIMDEFKDVYRKLFADKKNPVLIFDTCIHSGDTLSSVVSTMRKLGFKDVRVGSINPSEYGSSVRTDFYITRQEPVKGCYPFDRDRMIEKTFEHVYSKPSRNPDKRDLGNRLRKEIKRIMQEQMHFGNI
jgi:hypothetical protein